MVVILEASNWSFIHILNPLIMSVLTSMCPLKVTHHMTGCSGLKKKKGGGELKKKKKKEKETLSFTFQASIDIISG